MRLVGGATVVQCLCKAFPWQALGLPQRVEAVEVPSWLVPTVQDAGDPPPPDVHNNLLHLASRHLPPVMSDYCC